MGFQNCPFRNSLFLKFRQEKRDKKLKKNQLCSFRKVFQLAVGHAGNEAMIYDRTIFN
jgi:hypothetical protein